MKIGISVGDVMTKGYISASSETSIIDCAKKMVGKRVGNLIIEEDKKLKGILSERDIIWALTKKQDLSKLKAKDIMSKKVHTIGPSKDISQALIRMNKKKVNIMPITSKKNVIGVLTIKDILKIEPSLIDIASQQMLIMEEKEKFKRKEAVFERFREGQCEECEAYGPLYEVKGKFLCETCQDSL